MNEIFKGLCYSGKPVLHNILLVYYFYLRQHKLVIYNLTLCKSHLGKLDIPTRWLPSNPIDQRLMHKKVVLNLLANVRVVIRSQKMAHTCMTQYQLDVEFLSKRC